RSDDSQNLLKTPRISVIIPVLQEEKLLENTLKIFTPALKKHFNLEVIVSDGGSKDKTIEIAKKYADRVIIHTENRRQTIAEGRNVGAAYAKGETLVFINGDTIPAEPEHFFKEIVLWTSDKTLLKTGALTCSVKVSPHERKLSDTLFHSFFNSYVRFFTALGAGMGRGECQIIRAEVFKNVGGYDAKLVAGEDFELYSRISKKWKIGFKNDIFVYESPRRFRKYGYIRILATWAVNALSVMFFKKSSSKEWEAVR
ncbi:MAG TPA: glycosyltransferase, partial [Patescibacteria group bacterium]|nr:glycosyltransferase [Patescibacteria group bacterium]